MNVNLTPHYEDFVQEAVSSGRYGNVSEVVRAALRLLEDYETDQAAKLKDLRTAIAEGENSPDVPYNIENVIARGRERRAQKQARGRHV